MKAATKEKWQKFSDRFFVGGRMDVGFLVIVIILLSVGLVMLLSASYANANFNEGNPHYYFNRQAKHAIIGVVAMLLASRVNMKAVKLSTPLVVLVSIVLLVLVLKFPSVTEGKENIYRWLEIGGVRFQPSEVAKYALVLFSSVILSMKNKIMIKGKDMSLTVCFLFGMAICGLIIPERHLSCLILMAGILAIMLALGGLNKKFIAFCIIFAVLALALVLIFKEEVIEILPRNRESERIIYWLDKESAPQDNRWQTNQSLYALGSGGLFGAGLGESKQKFMYMPEPQNDFIFAIICEELGFIGGVAIILLFAALIWRGFTIAVNTKDRFGALMTMGIVSHIGLQTVLNILVVTDAIPNTGISLPFFSFGGTSLLMILAEMGIVLSVSRTGNRKPKVRQNVNKNGATDAERQKNRNENNG